MHLSIHPTTIPYINKLQHEVVSASGKRQHDAPVSPEGRGLHTAPRGGKGEGGESAHWLENMCEAVGERAGKLYFNMILEERGKSY